MRVRILLRPRARAAAPSGAPARGGGLTLRRVLSPRSPPREAEGRCRALQGRSPARNQRGHLQTPRTARAAQSRLPVASSPSPVNDTANQRFDGQPATSNSTIMQYRRLGDAGVELSEIGLGG